LLSKYRVDPDLGTQWPDDYVDLSENPPIVPLHGACAFGHLEMVDLLLNHGADVNRKTKGNNSQQTWTQTQEKQTQEDNPLRIAFRCGNLELIRKLLDRGAIVSKVCPPNAPKQPYSSLPFPAVSSREINFLRLT
jgi:ankyrin repeat protein